MVDTITVVRNNVVTREITVTRECPLCELDNETGDLNQYNNKMDTHGHMTVTPEAALAGTGYGLKFDLQDTTAMYAEYKFSADIITSAIRFRAYLDPNSIVIPLANGFWYMGVYDNVPQDVCSGTLSNNGGVYQTRFSIVDNVMGYRFTPWGTLTDEPHIIEVLLTFATTPSSQDGYVTLWIDGNLIGSNGIGSQNDQRRVRRFQASASAIDIGTSGAFYIDEMIINKTGTLIGVR